VGEGGVASGYSAVDSLFIVEKEEMEKSPIMKGFKGIEIAE